MVKDFLRNFEGYVLRLRSLLYLSFYVFFLELFLNFKSLLLNGFCSFTGRNVWPSSFASLFWAVLPVLIIALFPWGRIRKWLVFICLSIISVAFIAESYIIATYLSPFSDSIALAILETNIEESLGFFKAINLSPSFFLSLAYLILIVGLTYLLRKQLQKRGNEHRKSLYLVFLLVVIPMLYPSVVWDSIKVTLKKGFPEYNKMSPFERIYWGIKIYQNEVDDMRHVLQKINNQPVGDLLINQDLGKHSLILIQGESLNRNYMSCYGYPLNTTPRLNALIQEGGLYLFKDVLAPSAHTSGSLPKVYSFYLNGEEPSKRKQWFQTHTIFSVLNEVGYHTHWLSNQEQIGLYLNSIAAMSYLCKTRNYIRHSTSRDWWTKKTNYDGALLNQLVGRADFKADKFFELIHLMGSHAEFSDRYPKSFEKFTAKHILDEKLSDRQKKIRANYLNSILYNDYIVSEIIKHYANEETIIVYFSDHGFTVFDDDKRPNFCGHSYKGGGIEIPFMIYLSPKMKQAYPHLVKLIRQAQDKPFMIDAFPESMMGLLGITSEKYHRPKTNIFSSDYNVHRSRITEY